MKTLKKILVVAISLAALIVPTANAATYTDGISLPGVQGLDNPPYISRTWKATTDFTASATNGAQILLTNVVVSIMPDQAVALTILYAHQGGFGATNALVAYVDLSFDGGRNWTRPTPSTLIFSNAPGVSNAPFQPVFYMPYTNLAGAQLVRVTKLSNSVTAGTALVTLFPTNVTLATRKPAFWGR